MLGKLVNGREKVVSFVAGDWSRWSMRMGEQEKVQEISSRP